MSRWKIDEEIREAQERRRMDLWRKQREYDWRLKTATRNFMRDGLDEWSAENLALSALGIRP